MSTAKLKLARTVLFDVTDPLMNLSLAETAWRISQKMVLVLVHVHVQLKNRFFGFEATVPIRGGWPHPYQFERNPIPWSWGPMALSVGQ